MKAKIKWLVGGIIRRACWILFGLCPIRKNKIVFVSYYGTKYADSPRAVTEYILTNGEGFECVWAFENPDTAEVPDGIKKVKLYSPKYIYHMATAGFWMDNCRKLHCSKRNGQYYIQTWHGGFGLKKVEQDVIDKLEPLYIRMATEDASNTDLMLSNSRKLTDLYHSSFWYPDGEVLQQGLPRNDFLFNYTDEDYARIKSEAGIQKDVRVCLYAPTFRQDKDVSVYDIDYERLVKDLEKKLGGKWVVLLKLHPNILESGVAATSESVLDISKVNDIQQLYIISDIIISDYSSVMFDFALLERPVILYASDIEKYMEDRNFYLPLSELPFPVAQNNDELSAIIGSLDYEAEKSRMREFNRSYAVTDNGNAADACVEWMKNKL